MGGDGGGCGATIWTAGCARKHAPTRIAQSPLEATGKSPMLALGEDVLGEVFKHAGLALSLKLVCRQLRAAAPATTKTSVSEVVGRVAVLQWARAYGCPWNERTCAAAAKGGHFEVLQRARAHGCPWDALTCTNAALGGHLAVLQWARAHGCPWDDDAVARVARLRAREPDLGDGSLSLFAVPAPAAPTSDNTNSFTQTCTPALDRTKNRRRPSRESCTGIRHCIAGRQRGRLNFGPAPL